MLARKPLSTRYFAHIFVGNCTNYGDAAHGFVDCAQFDAIGLCEHHLGPLQRSLGVVQLAPMEARRGCGATRTQPLNFCVNRAIAVLHANSMIAPSSCGGFTMRCLLSSFSYLDNGAGFEGVNQAALGTLGAGGFHTARSVDCGGRLERLSSGVCKFPLATRPWSTDHRPKRDHTTCHMAGTKGSHIDHGMCSPSFFYLSLRVWSREGLSRGAFVLDSTSKFSVEQRKHK